MKVLKKLALATAVATMATSSFALEQLDDATLANTTAQDGITIKIDNPDGIKIAKMLIHDNTGYTDGSSPTAGALVIGNEDLDTAGLSITNPNGGSIQLDVDTDGGTNTNGDDAFVNVKATLPDTTIAVEGIWVGKSNDDGTDTNTYTGANQRGASVGDKGKILGGLSLELSGMSLNAQLGAQPQGAMAVVEAELANGLKISELEVVDGNGYGNTGGAQGGLYIGEVMLTDATKDKLTLSQTIDIDASKGIAIKMNDTGGFYGYMRNVGISNGNGVLQSTIGDVELVGLNMGASVISISGH